MSREILQRNFLSSLGLQEASISMLAGDASFRRYFRLNFKERDLVLMDAPPPEEDTRQFVMIANHLRSIGLNPPTIYGEDHKHGFLLLEDFGNEKFSHILKSKTINEETYFYQKAVHLLASLHGFPAPSWLPDYNIKSLLEEVDLFINWYWPLVNNGPIDSSARNSYHAAWKDVLALADTQKKVLVLRDFHADNLMWLESRTGNCKVGLLDFQDAISGSPIYDLVSLLEDVRRDVRRDIVNNMRAYYLKIQKDHLPNFDTSYSVFSAQRNTKILGIFTRLWKRDGKEQYMQLVPRTWRLLNNSLQNPALAPIHSWFEQFIPADCRTISSQTL